MLLISVSELGKLVDKELLKKTVIYSTGAKPMTLKEYGIVTHPLNIAPSKELIESVKTGMKPKQAAKKYAKATIKKNQGAIALITVVQSALQSNKVQVIVVDETTDHHKLEMACLLAALKKMGVKPFSMKDLKKEKVLKGKKKEVKKSFIKFMNNFAPKNDDKFAEIKQDHIFEILAIDIKNQYAEKDNLNKEARRKYVKRLFKALHLGKKKQVKKNLKQLKAYLKIEELDLPKFKKLSEGKVEAIDLVVIIGHMAALQYGEMGSEAYYNEMGAIITELNMETTLKEYKEALKNYVKAPGKKESEK